MANKAKPSAPDLFEISEDLPRPLHVRRKRLGGWKLIVALSLGLVGVLILSTGLVLGLTLQNLQSSLVTVE